MHLRFRLRLRLRNLKLASERGFTTVTLMGVLMVGGLLVAAGFAAVDPDISLSREDQDSKQAYGAAESGLQWYLSALARDNNYYLKCTQVPPPNASEAAPVNDVWTGSGIRKWRKLPGEQAEYTIELLPAPGKPVCSIPDQFSMVDPYGNMRLRATGRSRGEYRSIVATLRRRNFIDFIYFTDFETLDPAAYSSNTQYWTDNCSSYRAQRAGRGCTEIQFADNDDVLGPFHTNDNVLICGNPTFGRTPRDAVEINGPPNQGFVSNCGGSVADVQGTLDQPAGTLGMPPSNAALATLAAPEYRFQGYTVIELQGNSMLVTNAAMYGDNLPHSVPFPANGVIYVGPGSGPCTVGYDRTNDYPPPQMGCGDVWIKGTYGADLTIAADNDVVINGNIDRADDGLLMGLIANNFVRVYHPVDLDNCSSSSANQPGYLQDPVIKAAILALNHSFIVDNWNCGRPMGTLTVEGAIAQKFRGPVGTGGSGGINSGYLKNYVYNDRLRYREPPYFLDPVQAQWRIARQNEQIPAQK